MPVDKAKKGKFIYKTVIYRMFHYCRPTSNQIRIAIVTSKVHKIP